MQRAKKGGLRALTGPWAGCSLAAGSAGHKWAEPGWGFSPSPTEEGRVGQSESRLKTGQEDEGS